MTPDGRKANGKWVDRWREPDGTHRQRTFDRKGDRDTFRRERLRRKQLGDVASFLVEDITLGAFVEEWWAEHALVELETSTRSNYAVVWDRHLLPRLGSTPLRQITPTQVLALRGQLVKAGVGDATIYRALSVLQSILSHAVVKGRVRSNPVGEVRKPSQAPAREVPPIPPERIEQLRARVGARDALLVSLIAYALLRPQEALALEVKHVGDRRLRVEQRVIDGRIVRGSKTPNSRRHFRSRSIALLGPVDQDLREYMLATGIRRGLLFPRADGGPWRKHDYDNWRERVYQRHAGSIGLPESRPYDLRGSGVSLLVWEGRTMLEVAHMAGHSVQTCERHYARIFEDYDPAKRTNAVDRIREARALAAGAQPLFEHAEERAR